MYILYIALMDPNRKNPGWRSACAAKRLNPDTASKQALATKNRLLSKRKREEITASRTTNTSPTNTSPTCSICDLYYKKLIHTIDGKPGCCISCYKKNKKT